MDHPDQHRRSFLVSTVYGLWAAIGATLAGLAGGYLLLPPRARSQQDWVEVADLENLPAEEPTEIVFRRNRVDGWKVSSERSMAWVVNRGAEGVVAFIPQCTHLGCAYHWDKTNREFLCPCHTSTFNVEGKVLTGPAPRPLDRYRVRVEGGRLLLGDPQQPASGEARSELS